VGYYKLFLWCCLISASYRFIIFLLFEKLESKYDQIYEDNIKKSNSNANYCLKESHGVHAWIIDGNEIKCYHCKESRELK